MHVDIRLQLPRDHSPDMVSVVQTSLENEPPRCDVRKRRFSGRKYAYQKADGVQKGLRALSPKRLPPPTVSALSVSRRSGRKECRRRAQVYTRRAVYSHHGLDEKMHGGVAGGGGCFHTSTVAQQDVHTSCLPACRGAQQGCAARDLGSNKVMRISDCPDELRVTGFEVRPTLIDQTPGLRDRGLDACITSPVHQPYRCTPCEHRHAGSAPPRSSCRALPLG
jgi:hypothetical protein